MRDYVLTDRQFYAFVIVMTWAVTVWYAWLYGRNHEARYNMTVAQSIQETRYLKGIVTGQLATSLGVSDKAIRTCLLADERLMDSLSMLVPVEVE